MKKNIQQKIEKLSRLVKSVSWKWILIGIILLGIFLRTYNLEKWMTFNPDQARDALVVQNALSGGELPPLGPQAGNTAFKLGPIFYQLEYVSAKLFGPSVKNMAYPDLACAIFSIPLFFFLLRKLFDKNISLVLTFVYSLSFFVITYSRFPFNPNSIPFYTILFFLAILNISEKETENIKTLGWGALIGISMGVGIQLHALLFLAMPLVALLVIAFLLYKRKFFWKSILVALAMFMISNTGQLISEYKTGGDNIKSFFSGATKEAGGEGSNLIRNISNDTFCLVQGNAYIISSLGSGDKCNITKLPSRVAKKGAADNAANIAVAIFAGTFSIGGYLLLARRIKNEKNYARKKALILLALYLLVIFLIFIPVSGSISVRYYISVVFMPFVLLGLWMEFILEKSAAKVSLILAILLVLFMTVANTISIARAVEDYRNLRASTSNVAIYDEVENMYKFMKESAPGEKSFYLAGKRAYLSRLWKPLEYFGAQDNIAVIKIDSKKKIISGKPLFYVTKSSQKRSPFPEVMANHPTQDLRNIGNIAVFKLGN